MKEYAQKRGLEEEKSAKMWKNEVLLNKSKVNEQYSYRSGAANAFQEIEEWANQKLDNT